MPNCWQFFRVERCGSNSSICLVRLCPRHETETYLYPEIWVRANEQTLNCWRACSLGCMKAGVYKQTNMLQHFSMSKTCTHFAPFQTLRHECITIANKLSFPSVTKCCQVSGECLKNILRSLTLLKKILIQMCSSYASRSAQTCMLVQMLYVHE